MLKSNMTFTEAFMAIHGVKEIHPVIQNVNDRWNEPWRYYHNQDHLKNIIKSLLAAEKDGVCIKDGAAALGFTYWHDAVYDPQAGKGRNEVLSALLCREQMKDLAPSISVMRAVKAITATIDHQVIDQNKDDIAILLDCDLAILGSPEEEFLVYDQNIRKEYAHVPDEQFREGRRNVLVKFMDKKFIYMTDWGRAVWEDQARKNLQHWLDMN